MKRILLCLMVALFATGCLFAKNNDEKMNVMSYNIRYDNSGDKDNQWKFRRDFAADLVKFHEADVFGSPDKPGGLSIQLCKSEKKEFYIRYSS